MDWHLAHSVLLYIQYFISFTGVFIILSGIVIALIEYLKYFFSGQITRHGSRINVIRLTLGRTLLLGLEFIVAADLIGTTTTPDYYAVGMLAIIVVIRTLLSFSINRELMSLGKESKNT